MAVLRSNFAFVGDSGEAGEEEGEEEGERDEEGDGKLIKESDDTYTVWASGRVNCESFLAQIKVSSTLSGIPICMTPHVLSIQLHRRQDLLSILLSFIWPQSDSVVSQFSDESVSELAC